LAAGKSLFINEFEAQLAKAEEVAEARNIAKEIGRSGHLSVPEKDALMGLARYRIAELERNERLDVTGEGKQSLPKQADNPPVQVEEPVPGGTAIVLPAVSPTAMGQAITAWDEVARAIERPEDLCTIQGKPYRKASFWRKVRMAYRVSVMAMPGYIDPKEGTALASVRLNAPNGAFVDATGYRSRAEPLMKDAPLHNIIAKAETRAFVRGMRTLVGFGEPSAEEVDGDGA